VLTITSASLSGGQGKTTLIYFLAKKLASRQGYFILNDKVKMVTYNQIRKLSEIAILDVFEGIPDHRRKQGTRHSLPLCLALFTLAVVAGNHGFLSIGDWLESHSQQLKKLFNTVQSDGHY
jgi:hypothetical protein